MEYKVITNSNSENIFRRIKEFSEFSVYVGISDDNAERAENDDITNAELLFIHTNGSPANNIPARPVLQPAIEDDKEKIETMLQKSISQLLNGQREDSIRILKLIGMRAQNDAKRWFVNPKNNWVPNSPYVIREKKKKKSTNPRPLIDTGQLRNAITYFVKIGGRRVK